MKKSDVRQAILSRRGEVSRLASELGVVRNLVSQVLRGRAISARVYAACEHRAAEILASNSGEKQEV